MQFHEVFINNKNYMKSKQKAPVGGLSEYIVNGKTGFVVSNEKELSNKIDYFFKEKLFEDMSSFIRDYKKQFSWEEFERKVNE